MPVSIGEKIASRKWSNSVSGNGEITVDLVYEIIGTADDGTAYATLAETVGLTYSTLNIPLDKLDVEPVFVDTVTGKGMWHGLAHYCLPAPKQPQLSFDIGMGTQHITQSITTIAHHEAAGEDAVDPDGAIGWDGEAVEGADIEVPDFSFNETIYAPNSWITDTYLQALRDVAAAPVNNNTFHGYTGGEVLFTGASGSRRGQTGDWEISLHFRVRKNQTSLSIGGITGIDKNGWEYLWVRYKSKVSGNRKTKVPAQVFVEKVYEESDFSALYPSAPH